MGALDINTGNLQKDLEWLREITERRLNIALEKTYSPSGSLEKKKYNDIYELQLPQLEENDFGYFKFVNEHELGFENRLLIIMGLACHIQPDFFDRIILLNPDYSSSQKENTRYSTRFNELGGISGDSFRGFIPTGLTWLFLLAGYDMKKRIELMEGINKNNPLIKNNIIRFSNAQDHEPILSGAITIAHDWLRFLLIGDIQVG